MRRFMVLLWGAALVIGHGGVTGARDVPDQGSFGARIPVVLSCGSPDLSTWEPAGRVPQPVSPPEGEKYRKILAWCAEQAVSLPGLFETESRDTEWAAPMEQQLQRYLAVEAPQAGIRIQSVQCRQTVCRIRSLLSAPADVNNWHHLVASLEHEIWWRFWLTSAVLERSSGGWTTTLMLRRVSPSFQVFVDPAAASEKHMQ
jgi:hypothetical protein